MRKISLVFKVLTQSTFRNRFKLSKNERDYLKQKGMSEILNHANAFILQRLAPAQIPNDGKQTPMRDHPVFIAQHATATCCRNCLQQWHQIPKGHILSAAEITHILTVIEQWLTQQD